MGIVKAGLFDGIKRLFDGVPALAPMLGALAGALAVLVSPWFWIVSAFTCLILCIIGLRHLVWTVLATAAVCLSAAVLSPRQLPVEDYYVQRTYTAEVLKVRQRAGSQSILMSVADSSSKSFRALINYGDLEPGIRPGDSIAITTCFAPAARLRSDGLGGYADRSLRLSAVASCWRGDVEIIGHSSALRWWPARAAERLREAISDSELSDCACNLLQASLLGMEGTVPQNAAAFREAGLAHLLCVSGFHVGLIAALIGLLLLPLRLWIPGRLWGYGVVLPAVWLFIAVSGAGAPAVRAGVMLTALVLSRFMERGYHPFNALAVAMAVIIIADPYSIYSAGLWLAFAAVAGILAVVPSVQRRTGGIWRIALRWVLPCVAATLGTVPVTLAVFHKAPLMNILGNVLVVPFFGLFVYGGIASVALNAAGLSCGWLTVAIDALAAYFTSVASVAAMHSFASISHIYLSPVGIACVACAAACAAAAMAVHNIKSRIVWSAVAALSLLPAVALSGSEYTREAVMADDICLVNNGREAVLHTFSNDGQLIFNYTSYFRLHGIAPSDVLILRHPASIPVGNDTLTVIDGSTEICGHEDYKSGLYVRTNNSSILEALTAIECAPAMVVLSSAIHVEKRLLLRRHYEARGSVVHDLALGPVTIPISQ